MAGLDTSKQIEEIKQDLAILNTLTSKFDTAIDKLSAVAVSIDKMLAVHENRLENQEKQTEIVHQRITEYRKELLDELRTMREEADEQHTQISERLQKLERWKWFLVGIGTAIGFIAAQIPIFFAN